MPARKVLLIGWDAADWKVIHPLIAAGQMPVLQRIVAEGATGQIATLHPPLSPMLWTSIATGKRPFKHGIHGFSEPTPDGRGVQPISSLSRKTKALWNILDQNQLRSLVVAWWPSHPAEPIRGVMVSDHFHRMRGPLTGGWPMPPHAVHPADLASTIADLRVHPDQLVPVQLEPFIPLAREIDQDNDRRLGTCMQTLAECLSVQAASLWLLENQPWDFAALYFDSIDHFSHAFMRYHPPRQSHIAPRDFELYHNVVSAAYQLHDRMLGALLEEAGSHTTLVLLSDHGFHPDHLRPSSIPDIPAGPAVEHRDLGILALHGPGIKTAEQIYGPTLLDIAPTVLALYDLAVGDDMDGKVLTQAFRDPPPIATVPTWDDPNQSQSCTEPDAAPEVLDQLIALGYIEPQDGTPTQAVAHTIRELRYNLAQSYQDAGRHLEARQIFAELHDAWPDEPRFIVGQAPGLRRPPRPRATRRALERALAHDPDDVTAYLGLARLALNRKQYEAAAHAALEAIDRRYHDPLAHFLLGKALAGMHEYARAAHAFRAAISFNPNFPDAHRALARLLRDKLGDSAAAREHHRLARHMQNQTTAPMAESLIVVTGLPRSGTSMLMQMLAAGGMPILSDELRRPDDDNPRGYLEFEPVKNLLKDATCLYAGRGKCVKIVAPLLKAIPADLPLRVIFNERDLDEVLDSQDRMLVHRHGSAPDDPSLRQRLRDEYARTLTRMKALLANRPQTQVLMLNHREIVANPKAVAAQISTFLEGRLDPHKAAAAVDPTLYRNRA